MSFLSKLWSKKPVIDGAAVAANITKGLPKVVATIGVLQVGFAVLSKVVALAKETRELAEGGFTNLELDKQELEHIIELIEAFKPMIDLLGDHVTGLDSLPLSLPAPAPAA
jgi:hypothetical protein